MGIGDWGLGIGAASKIGNRRFSNTGDINKYISAPVNSYENIQELSVEEEMEETMFLGLRMVEGVSMEVFQKQFGIEMNQVYGEIIKKHISNGLLSVEDGEGGPRLCLTVRGMDVSNYVMSDFLEPVLF